MQMKSTIPTSTAVAINIDRYAKNLYKISCSFLVFFVLLLTLIFTAPTFKHQEHTVYYKNEKYCYGIAQSGEVGMIPLDCVAVFKEKYV